MQPAKLLLLPSTAPNRIEGNALKSVLLRIAAVLCASAPFTAMAQNLLTNGSFESPVVPAASFTGFAVGSGSLTGWSVIGPSGADVAIVSGSFAQAGVTFPAQAGVQWLDLTGVTSNSTEGVSQTVATIAGHQYQLSYFIGNTSGGGIFGSSSTVQVLVNGVPAFNDVNATPNTTSQTWQQFTHTIVASGASTTIAFVNADPSADNSNGLDNVSLVDAGAVTSAAPALIPTLSESVLMLLAALLAVIGGAAIAARRR